MLDQVREFHGQLAEYYDGLSDEATRQRVKMLLDYMSSHEKNLQASLSAYEEGTPQVVLDTWVDCRYCEEVLATCEQTPITPELSVDGLTKVAMDVDLCLIRFYRAVVENAESHMVREIFKSMITMEEDELRKQAFSAQQANDI
jgi:hypothetical protein